MEYLKVTNITKTYAGQQKKAIENVSFTLNEGEILAVVGENGSGKSTLLKLINGLLDADEGAISFREEAVTGPAFNLVPGHRDIRMLSQEFNLLPRHTIRDNIGYNIRLFSEEVQQEKVNSLIQLCRLEGLEDKLPMELSGGQQQRAALAKAIADNPSLLLMDEPFSNLDLFLKEEIKTNVVRRIREDGHSAIFVTHDLKDALALSNKIAVLREGKLLQLDTPHTIYEKPINEYVAYLFGNVNILPAKKLIEIFHLKDHKRFAHLPKEVKATVRPEHIQITRKEKGQASGKALFISYLGDSYDVDVEVGKIILRVNTRKKEIQKGDKLYLKISYAKIHLI